MKKELQATLHGIAVWMSRPHVEARDTAAKRGGALLSVGFLAGFALLSLPFFGSIYRSINFPTGLVPDVTIPLSDWTVLYSPKPAGCSDDERFTRDGCLASPGNPRLWRSGFHRSDTEHFDRSHAARGRELWVGAEIPVAELQAAHAQGADQLLLGWFEGTYRIWVDGLSYGGTQGWNDFETAVIEVPLARLARPQPLQIAIRIDHNVESIEPDMMAKYLGGEGFFTSSHLLRLKSRLVFWWKARPFALFITYILLSLAFLFFWMPVKLKKEYFYLSLYTLVLAFDQARLMDLYISGVTPAVGAITRALVELYTPLFGLLVGLAFARYRPAIFRVAVPLAIVGPILLVLAAGDTNTRFYLRDLIRMWGAPACYLLGSLACFTQSWQVRSLGNRIDRTRWIRLLEFGAGMLALGIFYAVANRVYNGGTARAWMGYEHFAVLMYLGAIALRDFRASARLINRTPVSEYHRREILPEQVSGALLVVHLETADDADQERLHAWRARFYAAVFRAGGTVVYRHGEDVMAFFDQSRCDSPARLAFQVLDDIAADSSLLGIEGSPGNEDFLIRSSLVLGDLRPVWEETGGHREPYWEEAGYTTPFVEASRLLELGPRQDSAAIFLKEDTARQLIAKNPDTASGFVSRDAAVTDKHGQQYRLAVYRPRAKEAVKVAA